MKAGLDGFYAGADNAGDFGVGEMLISGKQEDVAKLIRQRVDGVAHGDGDFCVLGGAEGARGGVG